MTRPLGKRILLVMALLAAASFLARRYGIPSQRREAGVAPVEARPAPPKAEPLVGEKILAGYNQPGRSIQNDLEDMGHLLHSFRSLIKVPNALPLGANEEIAAAMLGKNPYKQAFLPAKHPALNERGQIIDRWGSPLFFHAVAADRIEIRSAGPDKQLWTSDDTQRNPDGKFSEGPPPK